MAATPIYALPYPAAADPADVPLDMQELADRIEAVLSSGLYAEVLTSETTAVTANYTDLATVGPQVTIAATGLYVVSFGAVAANAVAAANAFVSISLGGAAPSENDRISVFSSAGTTAAAISRTVLARTINAGTVVKLQYRSQASGNASFSYRWLRVTRA